MLKIFLFIIFLIMSTTWGFEKSGGKISHETNLEEWLKTSQPEHVLASYERLRALSFGSEPTSGPVYHQSRSVYLSNKADGTRLSGEQGDEFKERLLRYQKAREVMLARLEAAGVEGISEEQLFVCFEPVLSVHRGMESSVQEITHCMPPNRLSGLHLAPDSNCSLSVYTPGTYVGRSENDALACFRDLRDHTLGNLQALVIRPNPDEKSLEWIDRVAPNIAEVLKAAS